MSSSRGIPASYTDETYDSNSGDEDYTALGTWESLRDTDLSAGAWRLLCVAGIHDDYLVAAGSANPSSSDFRVLMAASGAGHGGIAGAGVVFRPTGDNTAMTLSENYFQTQDFCVSPQIATGSTGRNGINVNATGVRVVGVIVHDCSHTGEQVDPVFFQSGCSGCEFWNSAIVDNNDCSGSSGVLRNAQTGGTALSIYNTTIVRGGSSGGNIGIWQDTTLLTKYINVIVDGFPTNDFDGVGDPASGSDHNCSVDGTEPGTNGITGSPTYRDPDNGNYQLDDEDAIVNGFGVDPLLFTDDGIKETGEVKVWSVGFASQKNRTPTLTLPSSHLVGFVGETLALGSHVAANDDDDNMATIKVEVRAATT